MKLKTDGPMPRHWPRAKVLDQRGAHVGDVAYREEGSGWTGRMRRYSFRPNDAGLQLGLREFHASKLAVVLRGAVAAQPTTTTEKEA
jgi:hypothetical protein